MSSIQKRLLLSSFYHTVSVSNPPVQFVIKDLHDAYKVNVFRFDRRNESFKPLSPDEEKAILQKNYFEKKLVFESLGKYLVEIEDNWPARSEEMGQRIDDLKEYEEQFLISLNRKVGIVVDVL